MKKHSTLHLFFTTHKKFNILVVNIFSLTPLFCFLFANLIFAPNSWSYVLPLPFLLKKAVSTTGKSTLQIEQEVTFNQNGESFKTHELWFIEGDKNQKITAQSLDATKTLVYNALYNSKFKTTLTNKNKSAELVSSEYFQKLLFIRSVPSFLEHLKLHQITTNTRLSKADGLIAIAIGDPSKSDQTPSAQIWIDPEQFLIRKIKFSTGSQIRFSNYFSPMKDVYIAKTQLIEWAGNKAVVQIKNVTAKPTTTIQSFYPQNFESMTEMNLNPTQKISILVEDFYKRFR